MNTLKLERKDIYEIEVNDRGETIVFEMGDITLPFRLNEAYGEIDRVQEWLRQKLVVIEKQKDTRKKNSVLTENQKAVIAAREQAFKDMRKAMDKFLGNGGCQKIFGESNYLEMFNDLFDALTQKDADGMSHLDRMKISSEDINRRIEEKYSRVQSQVI